MAPGASGEFPFTINSTAVHGKFVKTITITTNDPLKPSISLRLEGESRSLVKADPTMVAFGLVAVGSDAQERRVKLTSTEEQPLKLTLPPASPGRRLKYALETKVPGKEYELVVSFPPPFAVGPLNEAVSLDTGDPRQKTVEVRSVGTVVARLAVEPETIQMTEPLPGQPFKGSVHFRNRGAGAVKVTEASAEAPEVKVAVREIAPGHDYEITVETPATFAPPLQGTVITVRTDDAEKPSMTFRIMPKVVPQRTPAQLVGQPTPSFSFKTLKGKEVSNATASSEVTLLNFVAADSPPSKRQIPAVAKVVKEFAGKPVRLVLVAQKQAGTFTADQVKEFVKATGLDPETVELAVDMTNTVGTPFLVSNYPALVYLSKDGKIAGADLGTPADLEVRVRGRVGDLLAGKVSPAPAPTGAQQH